MLIAELNIQQALSGTVLVPPRKEKYAELDEKIFNAVGYYGRVDTEMNCRTTHDSKILPVV